MGRFRKGLINRVWKLHKYLAFKEYVEDYEIHAKESMKKGDKSRRLTVMQEREIVDFYKSLTGIEVSTNFHKYMYSRTGIYTKDYMPQTLFMTEIIGRANHLESYLSTFVDKNLADMMFPQLNQADIFLKNINGYYYYEGKPVTRDEAVAKCQNIKEAMIKPSRQLKGKGIKKISVQNGVTNIDNLTISELFDSYKSDFQLQAVIHQHKDLAALNPTSVNTYRICTYRSGMEILLVYSAIRIGRLNQVIDNQSAGGISAKINLDGTLAKYGFGKAGDDFVEKTDTGVVLEGYRIPEFDQALSMVKELHYYLPLYNIVGWDVAIDESGKPVLVEWNGRPGPSQTACGTGYGELTERIIREIWPKPNSFKSFIRKDYHVH